MKPRLIDLGWTIARLDIEGEIITIISPSYTDDRIYPAESVTVAGKANLIALRDALNETYPVEQEQKELDAGYRKFCDMTELAIEKQKDTDLLQSLLESACARMDRARELLAGHNPRPERNWGILDTSDLRKAMTEGVSKPIPGDANG